MAGRGRTRSASEAESLSDSQEIARVNALHVLDTPPEERFDRVVRLAQRIFDAPKVAVNLIDKDRQYTKASVGVPLGDSPRSETFCSSAVADPAPLLVPDVRADERGGDLRIAGTPEQVRSVLRLTNLDRVLRPYESVEEARRDW